MNSTTVANSTSGENNTVDTDGDGLTDQDEIEIWGTSPTVADTDGDGFSDFTEVVTLAFDAEVNNYQFNPRIADIPGLQVDLAQAPLIYAVYETSEGVSETVGSERSDETREASSREWGEAESVGTETTHTVGVSATVGVGSVSATASYSWSYSQSRETTTSWTEAQTTENANTVTEMEQFEENNTVSTSGGKIAIATTLTNTGNIAYYLDNLTLAAYELDPLNPANVKPVATLTLLDGGDGFPRTQLDPGETTPPLSFEADIDLVKVKELLRNSRNLIIAPATWVLEGDGNIDFELAATAVNARTAQISIDFGFERPSESHKVSTVSVDGSPSITVREALEDVLKVPFEEGIAQITRPNETAARDTESMVTSLRGLTTNDDDNAIWLATHLYPTNNGADTATDFYHPFFNGTEFGDIVLQKGHVVKLVYLVDRDRDTLGERSEFALGTAAENDDSDMDGLTDGFEVAGWVVGEAPNEVTYRSDPSSPNTDGDLLSDYEEWELGLNPGRSPHVPPTLGDITWDLPDREVTITAPYTVGDGELLQYTATFNDGTVESGELDNADGELVFTRTLSPQAPPLSSVEIELTDLESRDVKTVDFWAKGVVPVSASGFSLWPIGLAYETFYNDNITQVMIDSQARSSGRRSQLEYFGPYADGFGGRMDSAITGAVASPYRPSSLATDWDYTIGGWFSFDPTARSQAILGLGGVFATYITNSGDIILRNATGLVLDTFTPPAGWDNGDWHYIAMSFVDTYAPASTQSATVYWNGTEILSGTRDEVAPDSHCSVFFGGLPQYSCPLDLSSAGNGVTLDHVWMRRAAPSVAEMDYFYILYYYGGRYQLLGE